MMNDPNIDIRPAVADDAEQLAQLGAATFTETFGHLYPEADLQAFLESSHSTEAWSGLLAEDRVAIRVALLDGRPIGFITVGSCKLPVEQLEADAGEIRHLYVLREHQQHRLGSRLMDIGLAWLAERGMQPLYIGVWSENYGAQRFYARYGFSKVAEYGFRVGETVDREFILKR